MNANEDVDTIDAGSWVEVEIEILGAGQRAPQVPPDTAGQPLLARLNARLVQSSRPGGVAIVETFIGRTVSGTVQHEVETPPVTFGAPNPHVLASAGRAVERARPRGTDHAS